MLSKLNLKNLSYFLGFLGFLILFILFAIPCGVETHEYNFYSLLFAFDDNELFHIGGLIYFIIFIANFLLYLSLSVIKILKKDTIKTLPFGYIGTGISILNIIFTFGLVILYWDISILLLVLITLQFIGITIVYLSYVDSCKNPNAEATGLSPENKYFIYTLIESLIFILPIFLFIGFLGSAIKGGSENASAKDNKTYRQNKLNNGNITYTQNKLNNGNITITVGNETYLLKDNKLFDITTNEEIGYLDNGQVIMHKYDD